MNPEISSVGLQIIVKQRKAFVRIIPVRLGAVRLRSLRMLFFTEVEISDLLDSGAFQAD